MMCVEDEVLEKWRHWDGEGELDKPEVSNDEDSGDEESDNKDVGKKDDVEMLDAVTPPPPERVLSVYQEAAVMINCLKKYPEDRLIMENLEKFNATIEEGNTGEGVSPSQWKIPLSFLRPHYSQILEENGKLQNREDPAAVEAATKRIKSLSDVIDEKLKQDHLPTQWSVSTRDGHLESPATGDKAPTTEDEAPTTGDEAPTTGPTMEYPWPTARMADGSVIIGYRQGGLGIHQVCIESVEDNGRVIRRHKLASRVPGAKEYIKNGKNLAKNQSRWSKNDRPQFQELLWITQAEMHCKDLSKGKKNPPADCCVRFKGEIDILTVTSLGKVLTPNGAREEIEKVCKRDGVVPPWSVEPNRTINAPVQALGNRARGETTAVQGANNQPNQNNERLDRFETKTNERFDKLEANHKILTAELSKNTQSHQRLEDSIKDLTVMMGKMTQLIASKVV